jgi:hypothetical protein
MRSSAAFTIFSLAFCSIVLAQSSTRPLDVNDPIPRATLEQMYQRELGELYNPKQSEALHAAHQLIEEYFEKPDRRKQIVKQLEDSKIDPNVLGRITRIRLNWPDLRGGVYYINERVGPYDVHYFLGIPKAYDRTKPWPLVVKLPTADAFVREPPADAEQVRGIYTQWMTEELTRHPDAILIMPLLNLDELWGPSYPGMNSVFQPMLHAFDRVNIDPARVHLFGHSMSAHAVWNLALHYPTHIASFCALAGGASADWQRLRSMNLRNVLPVAWHDANDDVIKIEQTRRLVRTLRNMKVNVEFEETKGIGHVPPEGLVERCYERMRGKLRELYPEQVAIQSNRPDSMFNRSDWVQIYQPFKPGDERRMYFRRGSGFMITHDSPWKVEATLANNRFTVTQQNVETLRLYLNDQMIDFTKPVTVNVNRRGKFEGLVKMSIDEMLKDQLFLGRGWRYYTGIIDIDLAAGPPSVPPATTKPRVPSRD